MADNDQDKTVTEITTSIDTPAIEVDDENPLSPGMLLENKYLIDSELGRGGVGVVYKAIDKKVYDRPLVVKVMNEKAEKKSRMMRKFLHESEALSRIEHPGVIKVYDIGTLASGKPFFAMEFVNGETLRKRMKTTNLQFVQIYTIIDQMGDALEATHAVGVFHRDIKPENIMLQTLSNGNEQAKLIDFGIAKVLAPISAQQTTAGLMFGTLNYMSPEQLMREEVSEASDVFSLAIVAYEMLTGRRPFEVYGETPSDMMREMLDKQEHSAFRKPRELNEKIPVAVENVLSKALSFDPTQRYHNAKEFAEDFVAAFKMPESKKTASDNAVDIKGKAVVEGKGIQSVQSDIATETADFDKRDQSQDTAQHLDFIAKGAQKSKAEAKKEDLKISETAKSDRRKEDRRKGEQSKGKNEPRKSNNSGKNRAPKNVLQSTSSTESKDSKKDNKKSSGKNESDSSKSVVANNKIPQAVSAKDLANSNRKDEQTKSNMSMMFIGAVALIVLIVIAIFAVQAMKR